MATPTPIQAVELRVGDRLLLLDELRTVTSVKAWRPLYSDKDDSPFYHHLEVEFAPHGDIVYILKNLDLLVSRE